MESRAGLGKEPGFPFMQRNLSTMQIRVDLNGLARVYGNAYLSAPGAQTKSQSPGTHLFRCWKERCALFASGFVPSPLAGDKL